MAASEPDGIVCETCGAWVLLGYTSAHREFHEAVTGLLLKVAGVCPSCKRPYDEPSCSVENHAGALLERWDVLPSALRKETG